MEVVLGEDEVRDCGVLEDDLVGKGLPLPVNKCHEKGKKKGKLEAVDLRLHYLAFFLHLADARQEFFIVNNVD